MLTVRFNAWSLGPIISRSTRDPLDSRGIASMAICHRAVFRSIHPDFSSYKQYISS